VADVGVDLKDLRQLVEYCFHQDVRDRAHKSALRIGGALDEGAIPPPA
jgi:hypothetical protein